MLSNVQWKKLWMSTIWHEEQEGMRTGYRYGTASVISCKVQCRYVDTICSVWYLSVLCIFCIFIINNSHVPNPWQNLLITQCSSPSWEANRFSASQEIPCILWKLKVHYRIQKPPWHNSKYKWKMKCTSRSCYRTTLGPDLKGFGNPDLIGGFSLKAKQHVSENTMCFQAPGIRHWRVWPAVTDAGQYGRNFTWTAEIDDLWPVCLLSEGHDPCPLINRKQFTVRHGTDW